MALKDLQSGENIIKEEATIYIAGKINVQPGWMVLTNKRLVFTRSGNFFFGLIGLLLKRFRPGRVFDIPLSEIQSYSNEKFGLNKKVLGVNTAKDGHLKFALTSEYREWEQAFKSVGK